MDDAPEGPGVVWRAGQWLRALLLLACAAAAARALYLAATRHTTVAKSFGLLMVPLYVALVLAVVSALVALSDRVLPWLRGRHAEVSPMPLRATLYLGFVAAAAHVLVMPQGHPLFLALSAGLLAGAIAAAAELWSVLAAIVPARIGYRVDIALMNLLLCGLLGELGLRVLARLRPSPLFAEAYSPEETIDRNRLPPGQLYFGFPVNRRGFYDVELAPRPPGQKLVACIADSFGVGVVPHDLNFTTVCEREIHAEVYDMGIRGLGPPEYLSLLQHETMPLRPDAIVVALFVGNDLHEWCDVPQYRGHLLSRKDLLLYMVPRRLLRVASEETRRRLEVSAPRPPFVTGAPLSLAEARRAFPWLDDPRLEPPTFARDSYLDIEVARARAAFGPEPACAALLPPLFAQMKDAAGQVPLLVTLVPDEMQVEDELWAAVVARTPDVALDRDRPQRLVAAQLAALSLPVLDLLPVLRAVPPLSDGRRHLYLRNDTHWNARGNDVAGRALAERLAPLLSRPRL